MEDEETYTSNFPFVTSFQTRHSIILMVSEVSFVA